MQEEASSFPTGPFLTIFALVTLISLISWPVAKPTPQYRYPSGMQLLEVQRERNWISEDRPINVTVRWTVDQPQTNRYRSTITLQSADGVLWSPKQSEPPRHYRQPYKTTDWPVGGVAEEWHTLTLLAGTPPGHYQLILTLFDEATLLPQSPIGFATSKVELGEIEVRRTSKQGEFAPQNEVPPTSSPLQLLGYDADRATARPGDPYLLTLYWHVHAPSSADIARLQLRNAAQQTSATWDRPITAQLSADQWQIGDAWRQPILLRLPANLGKGTYQWVVQSCSATLATCSAEQPLTSLALLAIPRQTTPPPLPHTLGETVGPFALLHGYDTEITESALFVTLVWQAEAETAISYRVFVHLLDSAGALIAQSDGEPAQWSYPTTAWLAGDFIVDRHQFAIPSAFSAEGHVLRIGLYHPDTGERLPVGRGGDTILLPLP